MSRPSGASLDLQNCCTGTFDRLRDRIPHDFTVIELHKMVDWGMDCTGRSPTEQRKYLQLTAVLLTRLPTILRGIAVRHQNLFSMFHQSPAHLAQHTSDRVLKTPLDVVTLDRNRGKGLKHNAHAQSWVPRTADVHLDGYSGLGRYFLSMIQTGAFDPAAMLKSGREPYHNKYLFSSSPYQFSSQAMSTQAMSDFTAGLFKMLERFVPTNKIHVWKHISYRLVSEWGVSEIEALLLGWLQGTEKKKPQATQSYGHVNMPLNPGMTAIATVGRHRNGHLIFWAAQLCAVPAEVLDSVTMGKLSAVVALMADEEWKKEMTAGGDKNSTYNCYELEEWSQEVGLVNVVRATITAVIQNSLVHPEAWNKNVLFQQEAFQTDSFLTWHERNHKFAKHLQHKYETSKTFRETTNDLPEWRL
jgi:hypothetical protein